MKEFYKIIIVLLLLQLNCRNSCKFANQMENIHFMRQWFAGAPVSEARTGNWHRLQ